MNKNAKILLLGSNGLLGSAIFNQLNHLGYTNILSPKREELNLVSQDQVNKYFAVNLPEYVYVIAAKVSGISEQLKYPADHGYINGMIILNSFQCAATYGVKKVLFIGSAAMYPKNAPQPIKEEEIYNGKLDLDLEMYGLTKLLGSRLCVAYSKQYTTKFISCSPCNLYGPNFNIESKSKHVVASIIEKIYAAKITNAPSVTMWGTGKAKREFIYSDDLADACHFLMCNYESPENINIGVSNDYTISEIVDIVCNVVEYKGNIVWDVSKPEGIQRRILDSKGINSLGWKNKININNGIQKTYDWFKSKKQI
jgi:GDP-L-fucose synthase